jgi:aspartyl/asparaginyl-tRNA synthetase
MLEPEVAFANLNDVAGLAEAMLKYVFKAVLEERADDMKFFAERVDKDAIDRLERFILLILRRWITPTPSPFWKTAVSSSRTRFTGAWISPPSTNATWLKNTSKRRWW